MSSYDGGHHMTIDFTYLCTVAWFCKGRHPPHPSPSVLFYPPTSLKLPKITEGREISRIRNSKNIPRHTLLPQNTQRLTLLLYGEDVILRAHRHLYGHTAVWQSSLQSLILIGQLVSAVKCFYNNCIITGWLYKITYNILSIVLLFLTIYGTRIWDTVKNI